MKKPSRNGKKIHNPKSRAVPDDVKEIKLGEEFFAETPEPLLVWVLSKLSFIPSVSEGRRLIKAGGLYLSEDKITERKISNSKRKRISSEAGEKREIFKNYFLKMI
ncbi:Tyrosine--tRNA ligase [Leptospira interrogans serovar Canicola]|nr:Tyrosine--tRNA ligase [Leptospira interrogans serovar Canicola]